MDLVHAEERYKSIIGELILEQDFGDFLFSNRSKSGFCAWYSKHRELFNESFYITHGLTKAVIVVKETGFVVKVPFSNLREDYCKEELSIYRLANDCGVSDFFAWCEKFFSIEKDNETVDFYIMEYVEASEKRTSNFIKENYPFISDCYTTEEDNVEEDAILELFCQLLGEEKFDMLNNFLEEEGISDLHGGNVGWKENGELVLCDYSGYMG